MTQIIEKGNNVTVVADNGKFLELFDFSSEKMMIEINGQHVFLTKADTNDIINILKKFVDKAK